MFRYFIFIYLFVISFISSATISGIIKNSSNDKSIPNANIYIKEKGEGTVSDPYGYYKIDLPDGSYTISITNIGFKTYSSVINITDGDIELNVNMDPAILEFGEISVKGLFSTRLGYESADVITKNDFESFEKESATEMLRMLPGVDAQFAHPNGRNTNLSIRGSSDYKPGGYNNRVLILLDGFPIQIPNSGAPDWNSLPLESIQRIELDNSPASAQYGHNSMGGVINLITDHNNEINPTTFKIGGGTYSIKCIPESQNHQREMEIWI